MNNDWRDEFAVINGVRLHWVEAGTGPLVVLLHGFPEFHYSWRHQIPALAGAGFRVAAPDLRGYNLSEKPPGVAPYGIAHLTADIAALIAHLGEPRAVVVGHDWGGAVAWHLAATRPEFVERLAVLNCPHPAALARDLFRPRQLRRSWYVFAFQIPWLPERLFRAGNYALLRRTLRREPTRPGAFTDADIERYVEAAARPGSTTATINYYRAAARRRPRTMLGDHSSIVAPTLLIWGERDAHLGLHFAEGLDRWVPGIRVERIPDASHWVQNDAPERVNELLVEFLEEGPAPRSCPRLPCSPAPQLR